MKQERWWTKEDPKPGRGIIPRDKNVYKGNTVGRSIPPSSWKLLEMKKIRNLIKDELRKINHPSLRETTTGTVAGLQTGDPEDANITALKELKNVYEILESYIFDDITKASSFASTLSEYLMDESSFEVRNFYGHDTVKRNAAHLSKLSEELQKATDSMNTSRRQALAVLDEIGMIAYRYDNGRK